jgi:hypothetical protein
MALVLAAPSPARNEVAEPCFEVAPARLSKYRTFATFFRAEELNEPGFEGLAFKLGCAVGVEKLAQVQTFPMADLYAVTPEGGPGVLLLLALAKECLFANAKRCLDSLLAPLMARVELGATAATLVDRVRPINVFAKDLIAEQFADTYDNPGVLAHVAPMYAAGPWPSNNSLEAYMPARADEAEYAHVLNYNLPPIVDHRAAPLIQKLLIEGADKLWLPSIATPQKGMQKIELIIERKTGAKLTREDRREMMQLVSQRGRKVCRTCKANFWPEREEQVDCDLLCSFAAVCSCGRRSRPERDGRRVPMMALQDGVFPLRCPCGELTFTTPPPMTIRLSGLFCPVKKKRTGDAEPQELGPSAPRGVGGDRRRERPQEPQKKRKTRERDPRTPQI